MPPVGGSTPVGVIDVVRRLVMQASVALRAIPRVIGIFAGPTDPTAIIPSASGARWWLQRLGLFTLQEPLAVVLPSSVTNSWKQNSSNSCGHRAREFNRASDWSGARKSWSPCSENGRRWSVKNPTAASRAFS